MKRSIVAAVALSCAFCAVGGSAVAADAEQVKVFDATELPLARYTVVKRIWTQTWRSAFWVSNYDEASDAIAALTEKAADEGANGVINLHCLNDTGGWGSGYFCYGLAIKLK
jgi:hypothetical protein